MLARNPDAARRPPGVEVVRGDLAFPRPWTIAWRASIQCFWCGLRRLLRAPHWSASRSMRGASYSSPLPSKRHTLFSNSRIQPGTGRANRAADRGLRTRWTFLRPGIFAGNAVGWWAPQIRAVQTVRWPYLDAPTAPIDERDIAAVAVRTLSEKGHTGAEYVLTGPQSLSQLEQLTTIGRSIGRDLRIEEISAEEARREWLR